VLFSSNVTMAVQDPSYPAYVDSSVMKKMKWNVIEKGINYQKNIRNGLRMDGKVVGIVVGSRKKSPDSGYEVEKDEDQEQKSSESGNRFEEDED
ncbi:hypothetical protein Tco_1261529, partial [Tanacetum coccineum]